MSWRSVENIYGNVVHGGTRPMGPFTELPLLKMRAHSVQRIAHGMTVDWRHQGEARRGETNEQRAVPLHLFHLFSSEKEEFGRGSY